MRYVLIYYMPGAAGNFLSRCINLLDQAHGWIDAKENKMLYDIDEKLKVLSYEKVRNLNFTQRDWVDFEFDITHYSNKYDHWDLPENSLSIWAWHPDKFTIDKKTEIAGPDDLLYKFYIDTQDVLEWTVMNALYKNSSVNVDWLRGTIECRNRSDFHRICLKNMIQGWEQFKSEFEKICDIIQHDITNKELVAIQCLYFEWQDTVLKTENIPDFKKQIGFEF